MLVLPQMELCMANNTLRRCPRFPINSTGMLVYTDAHGETTVLRFKVTDIGRHGMSLEAGHAIPVGTIVSFRMEKPQMVGPASVRYCAVKKLKYSIGLEFSGGLEWEDESVSSEANPISSSQLSNGGVPSDGAPHRPCP
jgi:hypothetical protein